MLSPTRESKSSSYQSHEILQQKPKDLITADFLTCSLKTFPDVNLESQRVRARGERERERETERAGERERERERAM